MKPTMGPENNSQTHLNKIDQMHILKAKQDVVITKIGLKEGKVQTYASRKNLLENDPESPIVKAWMEKMNIDLDQLKNLIEKKLEYHSSRLTHYLEENKRISQEIQSQQDTVLTEIERNEIRNIIKSALDSFGDYNSLESTIDNYEKLRESYYSLVTNFLRTKGISDALGADYGDTIQEFYNELSALNEFVTQYPIQFDLNVKYPQLKEGLDSLKSKYIN